MDGVYPVSLNWTDIESMARLTHTAITRKMIERLSLAERKTIEESTKGK